MTRFKYLHSYSKISTTPLPDWLPTLTEFNTSPSAPYLSSRAYRYLLFVHVDNQLPFIFITPFGRVRAAQFFLVFFVIVRPIGRRDMAERESVSLAVTVFFCNTSPFAMMVLRGRITVRCVVLRRGRPSGRQRSAGRKRFRTQQVLQLVVGLFASYHCHLFS